MSTQDASVYERMKLLNDLRILNQMGTVGSYLDYNKRSTLFSSWQKQELPQNYFQFYVVHKWKHNKHPNLVGTNSWVTAKELRTHYGNKADIEWVEISHSTDVAVPDYPFEIAIQWKDKK